MMSDSEKKGIDEDGVLIRKKDESAKDKGKIEEEEIPIDNLDSGGTDQPTSVNEEKSEISTDQGQEGTTFKVGNKSKMYGIVSLGRSL